MFLPGESHGQRGLESYSLWGCKESDTTKQLTHTHTHTHLCNVELFTDIVDVVELKCGIKAFIFFAVTEGINREIRMQKGSCGYLCPLRRMERKVNCSSLFNL